jgi:hypothetical protein
MATAKAMLVARRVEHIEAALEKLVHELKSAEGSHRETLMKFVTAVHEALRKRGLLTMHWRSRTGRSEVLQLERLEIMARPNFFVKTNSVSPKTGDAVNVAARYFVYKLYEATDRRRMAWHALRGMGEAPTTVARAVERGWAVVQSINSGRAKEQCGCLTDEGRALARKGALG